MAGVIIDDNLSLEQSVYPHRVNVKSIACQFQLFYYYSIVDYY